MLIEFIEPASQREREESNGSKLDGGRDLALYIDLICRPLNKNDLGSWVLWALFYGPVACGEKNI